MDAKSLSGVSWDTIATEKRLKAWLLARGHGRSEDDGREPSSLAVALDHVGLHGIGVGPRCQLQRCRAAGASFALLELAMFHGQLLGGREIIEMALGAEKLRADLIKMIDRLEAQVGRFHEFAAQTHDTPLRGIHNLGHEHEFLCVEPTGVLRALQNEADALGALAAGLRGLLASEQLRVPWQPRRTEQVLLTAICQHLRLEGFEYDEIVGLVPDGLGTALDSAVRRVVTRVRKPDARGCVPYRPPFPETLPS